ncbi:unnamed protein product, partial [Closterium sp. Yama58-4]
SRLAVDYEFNFGTALSHLSAWYYESKAFDPPTMVVTNGYDNIPKMLMQEAQGRGAKLVLNFEVTAISQSSTGVQITGKNTASGATSTLSADVVIVTIPLGVLKANTIAFTPSLPPRKTGAISRLGVGAIAKIFFFFNQTFWPVNVDEYFIEDAQLPANRGRWVDWVNLKRAWGQTALEGVALGEYAERMAKMSDEEVINDAKAKMAHMFPQYRKKPLEPLATWIQRWTAEPYSSGAYSYARVGVRGNEDHCTDYDVMALPEGRVLFAGEHTIWQYQATVHGALLSGVREARRAAANTLRSVKMDEELLLLQQQFQAAQEVKAATRLSERNVVELVSKLTAMGLLGEDLLYSLNGKEYITQERLQQEVEEEVRRRGRVSLVDLGTLLNVDLFYCERAAKCILETAKAQEQPWVQLVQGELITHDYWDGVADEVDAALQESGQVAVSDLAMRFNVGAELMASILSSRLGSRIHGTMSGGQLFTGAHMARMRAAVRGAARALTEAANMADIWPSVARELGRDYGREYGDGTEVRRAAGDAAAAAGNGGDIVRQRASPSRGTTWTLSSSFPFSPLPPFLPSHPSSHSFTPQNAFITFSALGIPQPRQYLESLFPDKSSALLLDSTLVHSSLVHQLDAAVEEAIAAKSWCDAATSLPPALHPSDCAQLLQLCPVLLRAQKAAALSVASGAGSGAAAATAEGLDGAEVYGDTCVVSSALLQNLQRAPSVAASSSVGGNAAAAEGQGLDGVESSRLHSSRKDEAMPTVAEMTRLVLTWHPDLLEATVADDDAADSDGDDAEGGGSAGLARLLVAALKPALSAYWAEERRRAAAFTSGSTTETRRQVREAVESRVNATLGQLVLYAHGAAAFNSDEDAATATLISRHVLRTSASEPVDLLLHAVLLDHDVITAQDDVSSSNESEKQSGELQEGTGAGVSGGGGANGAGVMGREEQGGQKQRDNGAAGAASVLGSTPIVYTPARRAALAKLLPAGGPRERAVRMIGALEGREMEAVPLPMEEVAEKDLGIRLKRPDKKAERALLFSMKKSLQLQLEAEEDAVAALPLIVALLFMQVLPSPFLAFSLPFLPALSPCPFSLPFLPALSPCPFSLPFLPALSPCPFSLPFLPALSPCPFSLPFLPALSPCPFSLPFLPALSPCPFSLPFLPALSPCPVSLPCLPALSPCPVSLPCLPALSPCPVSLPCLPALSPCPVSLPCLPALSPCPVSLPCLPALSPCPVSLPCLPALSPCPVSLPCLPALSPCPVSLPCLPALSPCPVSLPCLPALSPCPFSLPFLPALSPCPFSLPFLPALSPCPFSLPFLPALSPCPFSLPFLPALSPCPFSLPFLPALSPCPFSLPFLPALSPCPFSLPFLPALSPCPFSLPFLPALSPCPFSLPFLPALSPCPFSLPFLPALSPCPFSLPFLPALSPCPFSLPFLPALSPCPFSLPFLPALSPCPCQK